MKSALGLLAWIAACAVGLAACGAGGGTDGVVIGHPACLSGQYAKAGEQAHAGIRACVAWVNEVRGGVAVGGRKMPLVYKFYDCESRKESVTSLLERLVTVDKVDALLAPYSSGLTLAGAPIAERYGRVYLDHGGASDKIFAQGFGMIVQTIGPGSRYHVGTLDMLAESAPDAKRLALAYEDSEFARMVREGALAHARKLGYEVVFNESYPKGVSDLTPLLSAMKATRPDIFLGGGHFEDGQLLNRQMADLGIEVKALSLIAAATLPAFRDALTDLAEGVMGPSQWEYGTSFTAEAAAAAGLPWIGPEQDEFVRRFEAAAGTGEIPDYHAAEAGASVLALTLGIEAAGSTAPEAVRAALGELTFASFYGNWDIDEKGMQVGHGMVDVQWQDGERVIVWPKSARVDELRFPKAPFRR